MNKIIIVDLTNKKAFPNTGYRFSRISQTDREIIFERDFIGENPLHYYLDSNLTRIIVANSIREIKEYLSINKEKFLWDHARAVSNNKKVIINPETFYNLNPQTSELGPTLQEMQEPTINLTNLEIVGPYLRKLFIESIKERLASIEDDTVGILLSGGLDSITTSYYLKESSKIKMRAFTLKANEDDPDITKSRNIAKLLDIPLSEVKISKKDNNISIDVEVYDSMRNLDKKYHLVTLEANEVVKKTLEIAENPKKDNLFCSLAMYVIGLAIKNEGLQTIFCGEGPNEMINDYGFQPPNEGYLDLSISSVFFRQVLTFGLKESDMQLGRGGLGKHALSRMGKMFAYFGIRLESPFFKPEIANIITRIPYNDEDYSIIKPKIDESILGEEGRKILGSFEGISKSKFQDGSGISKIFKDYTQEQLISIFKDIYGANKSSYLKS